MTEKTVARIDWDRRQLLKELRRMSPDHPEAERPGSTDGLDSEQLAMREAADTIEALMAEAKEPAMASELTDQHIDCDHEVSLDDLNDNIAHLVGVPILPCAWHQLKSIEEALASLAPSPVQGADDRLAQAEAVIAAALELAERLNRNEIEYAGPNGGLAQLRRRLATYQKSPQAALNEVLEVGDVLDASVRYAKTWRAEGGEVFGPRLMLDLVAMTREAQDALNERPASALEEAADEWSKSEVVSHWDGYAENFLRARAAELRAAPQTGDDA